MTRVRPKLPVADRYATIRLDLERVAELCGVNAAAIKRSLALVVDPESVVAFLLERAADRVRAGDLKKVLRRIQAR